MVLDAPATIVVTTVQAKAVSRYGKRGEQYVYMDAGHMGQNVHLQAESLGLGTVMIGAYSDNEVIDVLGTKGETTVYIMPIGRPR
jgi:SagB-type dehydrogenase family enzyme